METHPAPKGVSSLPFECRYNILNIFSFSTVSFLPFSAPFVLALLLPVLCLIHDSCFLCPVSTPQDPLVLTPLHPLCEDKSSYTGESPLGYKLLCEGLLSSFLSSVYL